MKRINVYDVITEIEENFHDNGFVFEVTNMTQDEVKEDIRYQDGFKMLANEFTNGSQFSVEIDESKFLNDKNYEKDWFKIAYGDDIIYVCLRNDEENVEISAFEVNKTCRGNGFGRIVVEGIEKYARNRSFNGIKMQAFDTKAESFWNHLGYFDNGNGYLYKEV